MKLTIQHIQVKKTITEGNEVDLPDEPVFFFKTNDRVSVAVLPQYTTWMHEEQKEEYIISYKVIVVGLSFECTLNMFSIAISDVSLLYTKKTFCYPSLVVQCLIDGYSVRTRDQFIDDYNTVVAKCNNILL